MNLKTTAFITFLFYFANCIEFCKKFDKKWNYYMFLIANVEPLNISISNKYNLTNEDCALQVTILSCHIEKLKILLDFKDTIDELYIMFQTLFSTAWFTDTVKNQTLKYFNETLFNYRKFEKIYPYNLTYTQFK